MWWYKAAALAAALAATMAVLGACGFEPLHARRAGQPAAASELATIRVGPIRDRLGQQLRNHLFDILTPRGRPTVPRYILSVRLTESNQELAVRKNAFATRVNYWLTASYQLMDAETKRSVFSGGGRVVGSYNISQSEYATLIAAKDARAKAVREMSENIRTDLGVFFLDQAKSGRGGRGGAGSRAPR